MVETHIERKRKKELQKTEERKLQHQNGIRKKIGTSIRSAPGRMSPAIWPTRRSTDFDHSEHAPKASPMTGGSDAR